MSATFNIVSHRVGEGGTKHGVEVQRIQQLLRLNGKNVSCQGAWNSETSDALIEFQRSLSNPSRLFFLEQDSPQRPYVVPEDAFLLDLAIGANVLIRLGYGYRRGLALLETHEWCVKARVKFDDKSGRQAWGLTNYPMWAVVTQSDPPLFNTNEPLALDCTVYANLMMSVWNTGSAHHTPFNSNVKASGGTIHLAVDRYGYGAAARYDSADDIRSATRKHPDRLYCLEAGEQVGHMALLYQDTVYQCNVFPFGCTSSSLEKFVAFHPEGWISGPSPL
jgi:hypothetical protein